MIHYQLRCADDHAFDGWFRDSAAFEQQASRGLLECPECGTTSVSRALMAPAVGRAAKAGPTSPEPSGPPELPGAPPPAPAMPAALRARLQALRAAVERHCDYVGPDFAAEARRIHRGEGEARAIYGETTAGQAEALAEDGIEVARIPWIPRADG